jgi:hypothetical protein
LFDLQPKLTKATIENEELLHSLQNKQQEADYQKKYCEAEEKECNLKRIDANALRDECQA